MSKKLWLLVLVLLVPWPAHAESIGFAVSPPVVELVGNPGEQVSSSVQVTNLTDQTLTLDVDRRGFVAKGDEGQVDLVDTDSVYNLVPWFSIQNPSLELPARSTRSFEFNIQLPANA
ncbi:MAG TPA: hypothetical protein VLF41_02315, partial [Candidatus Nanoarchaeia archaeon]|nr:hypothetical protein [Candidatus Nanoarchaeia archaeon]